jgi:hypothetical protein
MQKPKDKLPHKLELIGVDKKYQERHWKVALFRLGNLWSCTSLRKMIFDETVFEIACL